MLEILDTAGVVVEWVGNVLLGNDGNTDLYEVRSVELLPTGEIDTGSCLTNLDSGIYWCRLTTADTTASCRFLLLK